MSWLNQHKDRIENEKNERLKKEAKERDRLDRRWNECAEKARKFYETKLKDLNGKKTKFGEFYAEIHNEYWIFLTAGDKKIGALYFGMKQDSDDLGYLGTYTKSNSMNFDMTWKDAQGGQRAPNYYSYLDEKQLAEYLLNFIK